jgi:ElaB/YqjD/DUF883 family membrane-anchored ribosome-binding protein
MQASAEPLPTRAGVPPVPPGMSPDLDRLTRDFRQFISDFETLLRNAQTLSSEGAAVARAELTRKLADARVKFGALKEAAGERATHARGATEEYVRREPMKAVLVAAAVGAIVALVVARR